METTASEFTPNTPKPQTIINGKRITNPVEILEAEKKTSITIFSQMTPLDKKIFTRLYNIPTISKVSKEICDADITLQEIEDAVKTSAQNKAPGPDGLPDEFYQYFWSEISDTNLS